MLIIDILHYLILSFAVFGGISNSQWVLNLHVLLLTGILLQWWMLDGECIITRGDPRSQITPRFGALKNLSREQFTNLNYLITLILLTISLSKLGIFSSKN